MDKNCDSCYKIICGGCGWEADNNKALLIKSGELTSCPKCGWKPGEN